MYKSELALGNCRWQCLNSENALVVVDTGTLVHALLLERDLHQSRIQSIDASLKNILVRTNSQLQTLLNTKIKDI